MEDQIHDRHSVSTSDGYKMLRIKWHPLKQLQEEAKLDHTISPTHCNTKAVCFNLFVNTMTQTIIRMPRNNATQGITEDHWEVPTSYG